MANIGDQATASAEKRVQKQLAAIYRNAQKEMREQMKDFQARFARKDQEKRAKLKAGEITQEQYDSWKRIQVLQSDVWRQKVEQATKTLEDANRQALRVINGEKMDVFAENANYEAYRISKEANANLSFSLYDKDTVGRLIKDQPELLPRKTVNGRKDRAWNQKKIANAVNQSIIQGESLPELAERIARDTASDNGAAMMRYAATAMTAAQNAGRIETMHRAQGMGIKCKKKWIATLDRRTRDTHRDLDGQVVDVDEPFVVDGMEIMYPGDPTADPSLVYNCRCTLGYVYEEYKPENDERLDNEDRETIGNMSYREWEKAKQKEQKGSESSLEEKLHKQVQPLNRFGERVSYSEKIPQQQIRLIDDLTEEFETKLKEVKPGAQQAAGEVQVSGTIMKLSSKSEATAAHEFAHSISIQRQAKFCLYDEKDFWKEIQKVRREYMNAVRDTPEKWISSYEHASKDLDEFFADAFALAILTEKGIAVPDSYGKDLTYANKVLQITKRFFGKR